MRKLIPLHWALVLLLMAASVLAKGEPKYVHPADVDWKSILPGPPTDGSDEQKAEIEKLLDLQAKRTAEEITRCKEEAPANAFFLSSVLGSWFDEKSLPITAQLLDQATTDLNSVSETAKAHYRRRRPFVAETRIRPCVHLETSGSYPSGHAVRGIVWATILSEMFPEHKGELMAAGKRFGDDREIAGLHYPSDVVAGQKLGAAIAQKMFNNPDFKADLERAKEECLSHAH